MKSVYSNIRYLFPGKNFYLLCLSVLLLFLVSILDILGVASILPIVQIASGADYTSGYLGYFAKFLGNPDRGSMIIYSVIFLTVAFVLKSITSLCIKWWASGFMSMQQTTTSVTLLRSYATASYLSHRKRETGHILNIMNSVGTAYSQYVGGALAIVGEGISIIMIMSMLLVMMPIQSLIAFLYFSLAVYFMQIFLRKRSSTLGFRSYTQGLAGLNLTMNILNGFRENIIFHVTNRKIFDYQKNSLVSVQLSRRQNFYNDLPKYIIEIIFIVGIAVFLAMMILLDGLNTAAFLLVFCGACTRILPSFIRVVNGLNNIRIGKHSVQMLLEEFIKLGNPKLALLEADRINLQSFGINKTIDYTDIKVEDISFRYPDGDHYVLKNINLNISSGSSLAIVGGSGSGKTTLIDILLGLIDPSSGQVTFNNKKIHTNLTEWHRMVGYVPQDVYIGGGTIREEVAYGSRLDEIDDERILHCLELADLLDVVLALPEGLDTIVGERGTRLSGGQRQRLGIARAIYRNPSVLILDEATSALDNLTEHKITNAINKIAQEITVIIVAHRLSTVRSVNQLVFMSGGHIVSKGTFEEVKNSNAEFARLVELGQLPE